VLREPPRSYISLARCPPSWRPRHQAAVPGSARCASRAGL